MILNIVTCPVMPVISAIFCGPLAMFKNCLLCLLTSTKITNNTPKYVYCDLYIPHKTATYTITNIK